MKLGSSEPQRCSEPGLLPDQYVLRGYLPTAQAIDLLIEARHPDLVSPAADLAPDARRAVERQRRSARESAVGDLRTALAEGDLVAALLSDHGRHASIPLSMWRGRNGLASLLSGRLRMQFPTQYEGTTDGQVLIEEAGLRRWARLQPITRQQDEPTGGGPQMSPHAPGPDQTPVAPSQPKPPIAPAELDRWYEARRSGWPSDRKPPSADDDLIDARSAYPDRRITREAVRAVRKRKAPEEWTSHGRRKRAPE
jgi:hypothetical protein